MKGNRNRCRNRCRMRCGVERCRHRFTLRKHHSLYVQPVKCPRCGDRLNVRCVEDERRREMAKRILCKCSAYPFPHEAGSLRMCSAHKLSNVQPTEEEFDAYEATISTPRGC